MEVRFYLIWKLRYKYFRLEGPYLGFSTSGMVQIITIYYVCTGHLKIRLMLKSFYLIYKPLASSYQFIGHHFEMHGLRFE